MAAPAPPGGFDIPNTYEIDPPYARYFTYAAAGLLGAATLCAAPHAGKRLLDDRLPEAWGFEGLVETWGRPRRPLANGKDPHTTPLTRPSRRPPATLSAGRALIQKVALWTPAIRSRRLQYASSLSIGAMFVTLLMPVTLVATLLPEAQLRDNSNRAGFLTLATLPWLFLLGGKSTGISTLTGFSYEKFNYLHRWLGRSALVLILIHMGLWVTQWSQYGSGYLSDRLAGDKERRGLFALSCLLLLAVPSIAAVRRAEKAGWKVFKSLHIVGFIGLIVGVNRHTTYAWPWTVGVIIVYAVDVAGRVARYRFKPVIVEALDPCGEDDGQVITRIRIQNVTEGWRAGQHVRLRLFFPASPSVSSTSRIASALHSLLRIGRPFESHPFSISNAPAHLSAIVLPHSEGTFASGREIVLYAKGHGLGSWTGDLHASASAHASRARARAQRKGNDKATAFLSAPYALRTTAVVDGPYGGLPTYSAPDGSETVLLIAGGSGISFIMGVLDELVGRAIRGMRGERCGKGTRTRKIEVVWCVADEGCISWFAPTLNELITTANASGALLVALSIHRSPRHALAPADVGTAKALDSISYTLLHASRCSVRAKLVSVVKDSINPCAVCDDCSCASGPEGCPADEEACCDGPGVEVPKLEREATGSSGEEITELPQCCRPPAPSPAAEERGTTCCGRCRKPRSSLADEKAQVDASEKTLHAGLDVRTGGLAVIACGPTGMLADVRNAVAGVPLTDSVRIGGIDVHCESFGI